MSETEELKQGVLENFKDGKYFDALDDLDALAEMDIKHARNIYVTNKGGMYEQLDKWADDVLRCSCDHILIDPDIINGDFYQEMMDFEQRYGVEDSSLSVSSKLKDAREIVDVESKVRPSGITLKNIEKIEKDIFFIFEESIMKHHSKKFSNFSHREKIEVIRLNYRENPNQMKKTLSKVYIFTIQKANIDAEIAMKEIMEDQKSL